MAIILIKNIAAQLKGYFKADSMQFHAINKIRKNMKSVFTFLCLCIKILSNGFVLPSVSLSIAIKMIIFTRFLHKKNQKAEQFW